MWDSLKFASILVGTVIGAGFITGKEIAVFFGRFLPFGYFGIFLFGLIFFLVTYGVCLIGLEYGTDKYDDFSKLVFGKLHYFSKVIVFLFMFCLFSAMISCGGDLINELWGTNIFFSKGIIALIIYLILFFNKRGVVYVNTVLTPLIIFGCIYIGSKGRTGLIENSFSVNGILSVFVYVSYNVITLICVLVNMNYLIKDKRSAFISSFIGSFFLSFIAFFVSMGLDYNNIDSDFPLLDFTMGIGGFLPVMYFIILFFAILTTAVSNAYGVLDYMDRRGIVCLLAFVFSLIDFSDFVSKIYVLFGYIGFFQVIIILFYLFLKNIVEYKQKK